MVKIGQQIPDFELEAYHNDDVKKIKLSDYKGKKLVLYFYPEDDTPGCTAEACDLRDNYSYLMKQGYAVVGVSPDDEVSHAAFAEKFNLPFPLIADKDRSILSAYEAWGEKNLYGNISIGVLRKTYVINADGIIEDIFKKVDTKNHTKQILRQD